MKLIIQIPCFNEEETLPITVADLPTSVLRFWETEFKKLKPRRTASGQRLYRKKDVETVLAIKHLLYQRKFTIPGARQYLKMTTGKRKGRPDSALAEVITELETVRVMLEKSISLAAAAGAIPRMQLMAKQPGLPTSR